MTASDLAPTWHNANPPPTVLTDDDDVAHVRLGKALDLARKVDAVAQHGRDRTAVPDRRSARMRVQATQRLELAALGATRFSVSAVSEPGQNPCLR